MSPILPRPPGGVNLVTEPTPRTVLIIEDNDLFRLLLRSLLSSLFPSLVIAEAGDAPEGLAQSRSLRPDVVFMDISLPNGNGLALTKKLKQEMPSVQVIVCTNHDTPEYRREAVRCGARQFVTKQGLDPRQVEALVRPLLDPDVEFGENSADR